jgi:hypothetical protein
MAVIHDENMKGKIDTNRMGIPTEGYGFSYDAKASLGTPSFSAASLSLVEKLCDPAALILDHGPAPATHGVQFFLPLP